MVKPTLASIWARALQRNAATLGRQAVRASNRAVGQVVKQVVKQAAKQAVKPATQRSRPARRPTPGPGQWSPGLVLGLAGPRRYWLYRPAGVAAGERLPLLVMLHGCGQDADRLAASTRMNRVAERERFLVL